MKTQGGYLISQIGKLQARVFQKLLRKGAVEAFNGAQGRILYVLWENERLTITSISQKTSLAKTTLTSMLDRMEAAGLVQRMPDPENRRQVYVQITEKAKGYKQDYDQVSEKMNTLFYQGFSEEEAMTLEENLKRIMKNLEGMEDFDE